jgi:GNAT superfamily N-acetyltransferase
MPISLPTSLEDKAGYSFPLDAKISATLWVLRILAPSKKGVIGQANCIPEGRVLRLMDIHITKDSRRDGLGSALMRAIIEAARFHFRAIEGVIKSGDLQEYPDLPSWYERHGFEVDRTVIPMTFSQLIRSKPQPGATAPTQEAIAAAARAWAKQYPFIQKVWLYGSRISGISSNTKRPPAPDTDWDIAVEIDGTSEDDKRRRWLAFHGQAVDQMQTLTNWEIDIHHSDPRFDPERVAVEVKKCGVLVYERGMTP